MKKLSTAVSTLGYIGKFPFMPGTAGSAVAAVLIWFGRLTMGIAGDWVLLFLFTFFGTFYLECYLKETGKEDPPEVVIDEAVGISISLLFVPFLLSWFVFAFLLFRFFDILKPFPLKLLEKLDGAIGVMADDIGAGIYAAIVIIIFKAVFL